MKNCDVVVIGAGPGGYVCAIRLAQLGKKIILVEKHKLGGECLNYGCIPSKSLIFTSSLLDKIKSAEKLGLEVDNARINMEKLQTWRKGLITKLNQGIGFLLKQNGVELVTGEAHFIDSHKIEVTSPSLPQVIEAQNFVIATGSSAIQIPGFEVDGQKVIGSKEALELSSLPKKMAILGGGVIGLEMANYFSKLGVEIDIVEMMDRILPEVDSECVHILERNLKKNKITLHTKAKAKSFEKTIQGITVTLEKENQEIVLSVDLLLVTVGRSANTATLNLEKASIKTDSKGFIQVDQNQKTSSPHIFAIGDVTGQPLLAHKASFEGVQVAELIAGKKNAITKRPISWAIFSDPEIAGVGLSEKDLQAKGISVQVGRFPFMALGRSAAIGEIEGFTKVVASAQSGEILGVSIVGTHASDLISEASLAVAHKLTLEDVATTIHPHPTLPEGIMEACEAALGHAIHIPNKNMSS